MVLRLFCARRRSFGSDRFFLQGPSWGRSRALPEVKPSRHGTARHGMARGTARGTARHRTAPHGTARHRTAQHGTARHGPPAVPFALFGWEGSPTEIDHRTTSTLFLTSLLEDLASLWGPTPPLNQAHVCAGGIKVTSEFSWGGRTPEMSGVSCPRFGMYRRSYLDPFSQRQVSRLEL